MTTTNQQNDSRRKPGCSGVLLVNLGTPRAPTAVAVRNYLREFLSDPHVVEIPRLIWLPILYGLILTLRPPRTARAYRKVWMAEGSPLMVHTRRQRQALCAMLNHETESAAVEMAMCYGQPSITTALESCRRRGVKQLVVLPLYPQYSATTTAAAFDAIKKALKKQQSDARSAIPRIHLVDDYHDNDAYIKACAEQIRKTRREHGASEKLLFSFHGLPKRNVLRGDPYQMQCRKTAELIARELRLEWREWLICFQSRFGRAEWLTPYTDETLRTLGQQGLRSVDVFCPGFAADCLETLEEIDMQNRNFFLEAGGERFQYIPALNDTEEHIQCLAGIVRHAWSDTTKHGDSAPIADF